jgi:hypothetical protein
MKGQFGLDLQGDPGSIYKVDGTTGVVTLFAKVMLDGVPNRARRSATSPTMPRTSNYSCRTSTPE